MPSPSSAHLFLARVLTDGVRTVWDLPCRTFISRVIGDWVEDVDPCETVEYVLPLLNSLGTDEGKFWSSLSFGGKVLP